MKLDEYVAQSRKLKVGFVFGVADYDEFTRPLRQLLRRTPGVPIFTTELAAGNCPLSNQLIARDLRRGQGQERAGGHDFSEVRGMIQVSVAHFHSHTYVQVSECSRRPSLPRVDLARQLAAVTRAIDATIAGRHLLSTT